jgi:hypothetical protein
MAETRKRDGRIPFHKQKRIGIEPHPGFMQRCVNDEDNRIQALLEGGYRKIYKSKGVRGGEKDAADASQMGEVACQPVGGGKMGYYMEIPIELWEKDQKDKLKASDEIMSQIGILNGIPKNAQRGRLTLESSNKTIKIEH